MLDRRILISPDSDLGLEATATGNAGIAVSLRFPRLFGTATLSRSPSRRSVAVSAARRMFLKTSDWRIVWSSCGCAITRGSMTR